MDLHVIDKAELRREFDRSEGSWHVLSREATWKALEEAVDAAFDEARQHGQIRKGDLRKAVTRHFVERVMRRARKVRRATRKPLVRELERTMNSVRQQRNLARRELDELRTVAASLEADVTSEEDRILYSEEERTFDRELRGKLQELQQRAADSVLDAAAVEELSAFVRTQRKRAVESGLVTDRERMAVLQRRIAKLNRTLTRAEQALRICAGKEGDRTAATALFRDLQGMAMEDPLGKAKVEILRNLFEENLEFRR